MNNTFLVWKINFALAVPLLWGCEHLRPEALYELDQFLCDEANSFMKRYPAVFCGFVPPVTEQWDQNFQPSHYRRIRELRELLEKKTEDIVKKEAEHATLWARLASFEEQLKHFTEQELAHSSFAQLYDTTTTLYGVVDRKLGTLKQEAQQLTCDIMNEQNIIEQVGKLKALKLVQGMLKYLQGKQQVQWFTEMHIY